MLLLFSSSWVYCNLKPSICTIKDLRVWSDPTKTRVVLDISDTVTFKSSTLISPPRFVIDFENTKLNSNTQKSLNTKLTLIKYLDSSNVKIKKIRHARHEKNNLRIVFDLEKKNNIEFHIKNKVSILPPNQIYGYRLIIDLFNPKKPTKINVQKQLQKKWRDILIVVDAGHGGEDPGATTQSGIHEKTITLAIANHLTNFFKKKKGFKVIMSRTGDYFVGLKKRNHIAREHKADLLISIHANTFDDPTISGSSVYTLSLKGATSETARWLETRENNADLIGGENNINISEKDNQLANTLLTLTTRTTLTRSAHIGHKILEELKQVHHLHSNTVGQAGFRVLKSPDVPAVLIETGFLSNPQGAKKLLTRNHRIKLAKSIFQGVVKWFSDNPPSFSYLKKWKG